MCGRTCPDTTEHARTHPYAGSTWGGVHTVDQHAQKSPSRRRRLGRRPVAGLIALAVTTATVVVIALTTNTASAAVPFEIQSLDGSRNNLANPTWGQAGTNYTRLVPARYAD